jgi:CPA2 family monovalent cation:H+ antiporter-2
MLLDIRVAVQEPWLLLGAVLVILLLKSLVTAASVLALRYPSWIALFVGLGLAQIGEFSLVLHDAGRDHGLSPAGLGAFGDQLFLAIVVLLMITTPFLLRLEEPIRHVLGPRGTAAREATGDPADAQATLEDHVIIGGYGLTGRYVERVCRAFGHPYRIVELNPVTAVEAEALGVPLIYGDLGKPEVLERVGIRRARLLVVAINDAEASVRIVQQAKLANPSLPVIARARYLIDADPLERLGADVVITEEVETALLIMQRVAQHCGIPEEEARLQAERLRTLGTDLID